jgi:hypothetical protein
MKKILVFLLVLSSPFLFLFFYFNQKSPEGVDILTSYIFGGGEDLILESDYLPESPVIKKELRKMSVGQTKRVTFKQSDDWRLSYALNPFYLTKTKDGFKVHQRIKFDTTGDVYTYVIFLGKKIKVYDNWINYLGTTPFDVKYTYIKPQVF